MHSQEVPMAAITPNARNHAGLGPLDSRHVRVAEMPWESTKFPGIEVKTLVFDKETGLLTCLLRMAPGAVLPDHEHMLIEQTYVLEGRLVDRDCDVGPGEFVWRPAGSRHAAHAPEGGLMIAIFQIPNKFYERDGRMTDMIGQDWEQAWRRALARAPA
jgi:anti-sigma factor ChrR (cupin superfamily)